MSDESLTWVRSHINECRDKHHRCAKKEQALLPTRILSIFRSLQGDLEVKLQETRGLQEKYACQSHRWGGSDTGTTSQDTYIQRLEGIPWTTIPKTEARMSSLRAM